MNIFGVIEVASARTTNAPGWAYVPDTGPQPAPATLNPSRKRSRNQAKALTSADLNLRQETRIRKELEALDRDNQRDINIPIPAKPSGSSRSTGNKHTANVRKILQSQKTFANHLDDYLALEQGGNAASASASRSAAAAAAAAMSRAKGAAAGQKRTDTPTRMTAQKQSAVKQEDTEMTDASANSAEAISSILTPYTRPRPAAHPLDDDPLLVSRVPPMPSDKELRDLMAARPLNYLEAKAGWSDMDKKYPVRTFCEVCGYWGRVKCMKCGTRVCALECLETHREECVTRYGL